MMPKTNVKLRIQNESNRHAAIHIINGGKSTKRIELKPSEEAYVEGPSIAVEEALLVESE